MKKKSFKTTTEIKSAAALLGSKGGKISALNRLANNLFPKRKFGLSGQDFPIGRAIFAPVSQAAEEQP